MRKKLAKIKKICYHLIGKNREKKQRSKKTLSREDDIMNAISLSNYIIKRFNEQAVPITNLKLQKILYYAQGYFFKKLGKPAFDDDIYAWHYGPVVPGSYYKFNKYGSGEIRLDEKVELPKLDKDSEKIIDAIISRCLRLSSSSLVEKTHKETPWKSVYVGSLIPKRSILSYFLNFDPLEIVV